MSLEIKFLAFLQDRWQDCKRQGRCMTNHHLKLWTRNGVTNILYPALHHLSTWFDLSYCL